MKGIIVDHKAERIHLLHAAGWASPDGTKIGSYVVHYANGETREIPMVYGEDVRDWWPQPNEPANDKLNPVWTGENTASQNGEPRVRLFKTTWQNPLADVEIQSIDYTSTMAPSAPFLIAITLE